MSDIYEERELVIATGSYEEKVTALADAEMALKVAKDVYREDPSEENRKAFCTARDSLQRWRKATRSNSMGIIADEVK